eukprot:COSAG02_NODE_46882_length_345_cov_0.841463_1_plen_65_part_01
MAELAALKAELAAREAKISALEASIAQKESAEGEGAFPYAMPALWPRHATPRPRCVCCAALLVPL